MRRAQAIFVVLALLALPLAPLAWGLACEDASVPMMCCLMHTTHSPSGQPVACHCTGKSPKHAPEIGMISPIPPVTATLRVEIAPPQRALDNSLGYSRSETAGFRSAPFEPPRG
jgi:hypothetical protein